MDERAIGVFDSGVGGLTVVKEIFKKLPNESIIYLGDTARVPYGTKSPLTVKRFSLENAQFLEKFGVKLIVVACNTASSTSLPALRKRFNFPIIGVIKPGVEKALKSTRNGRVGVIGTRTTIESKAYEKEIARFSKKIKVFQQSCPLFVPLAEEDWLSGKATLDIAYRYLMPLIEKGIDTIILGCTHYPILKKVISKVLNKEVKIIDSASSVVEEVDRILNRYNMLSSNFRRPAHKFFATDAISQFVKAGEHFLGRRISNARKASYV